MNTLPLPGPLGSLSTYAHVCCSSVPSPEMHQLVSRMEARPAVQAFIRTSPAGQQWLKQPTRADLQGFIPLLFQEDGLLPWWESLSPFLAQGKLVFLDEQDGDFWMGRGLTWIGPTNQIEPFWIETRTRKAGTEIVAFSGSAAFRLPTQMALDLYLAPDKAMHRVM